MVHWNDGQMVVDGRRVAFFHWIRSIVRFDVQIFEHFVPQIFEMAQITFLNERGTTGRAIGTDGKMQIAFQTFGDRRRFLNVTGRRLTTKNENSSLLRPTIVVASL